MDNPLFFRKNYLNCTKIEIAYEMYAHAGENTNYLFYNAYEPAERILHEILLPQKNFWEYKTDTLNKEDLQTVGVKVDEKDVTSPECVDLFIRQNLDANRIILFISYPKYIPGLELMGRHNYHTIMIEDYSDTSMTYRLNDIVNIPGKSFDKNFVLQVLQKMQYPIWALDFNEIVITERMKEQYISKSNKLIQNCNDDCLLFNECIEIIHTYQHIPLESTIKSIDSLRQVFYIIAGSRYNYSKFLQQYNYPSYLLELLVHCSDLAELIKNMLIKLEHTIDIKKKLVSFEDVINQINILMEFEKNTRMSLKKELLQLGNEHAKQFTCGSNHANPENVRVIETTSSSVKIQWDANLQSNKIISYVVQLRNESYETKGTKLQISNLQSESEYNIKVKTVDIFGNISEPGADLTVVTRPRKESKDIALFSSVTASSTEDKSFDHDYSPYHVVDGDETTRWSSKFSEPQWICIDVGVPRDIKKIEISWEEAYAEHYDIQVSNDCLNWTKIYSVNTGKGGFESIHCEGNGRYIRFVLLKRYTIWGFSIWNINIFDNS
ncbi:discoidin domain-containing protein [Paenibacillus alvei]|uniref:galactose-binding domain-containing protein n=1 Tax=Paenibacillus alvei TaxID=44250 RepID=UPI00038666F4|nr:discoidin domain-containing protein [Paenibacillus alvei]EPY14037.1 Licheninase [Paenibacillus alvei A6-6i-x]